MRRLYYTLLLCVREPTTATIWIPFVFAYYLSLWTSWGQHTECCFSSSLELHFMYAYLYYLLQYPVFLLLWSVKG
jgi:hypothetical protein